MDKSKLLIAWHSKARCYYSQYQAARIWRDLLPCLTDHERMQLSSARSHGYISGWDEFDSVCAYILEHWHQQKRSS